jgi:hypothetical protein
VLAKAFARFRADDDNAVGRCFLHWKRQSNCLVSPHVLPWRKPRPSGQSVVAPVRGRPRMKFEGWHT